MGISNHWAFLKGDPVQSLEKAIQTFMDEALSSDMDNCLTLESRQDPKAWVQITWNSLNFSFPFSSEPIQYLKSKGVALPKGSKLLNYESGSFATFDHGADDIPGLAQFVRQYFLSAFNIAPDINSLVIGQEQLGKKKDVFSAAPGQKPAFNSSTRENHLPLTDIQNQIRQLLEKTNTLRASGQRSQLVDVYSQIIDLAPNYVSAYVRRGLLVHEMGYPEKAMTDFEQAIHLDPQCGLAYYGRGWVKHIRGDFAGEMQDAKKGLLLDSQNAGMYYRRIGSAYQGLQQYQDAINAYNEAINFYSGKEEGTIYNRGMCYLEMKIYPLALADFNRCLEMDPDWAWAFAARGRTYLNMGNCKKAIADCDMAIKYQPNYDYSYLTRGLAYEELGDKKKAKTDFEHILKITGSSQLRKLVEEHLKNMKSGWGWFS
jgi:tetratricopeptide (TPR) repeat protein